MKKKLVTTVEGNTYDILLNMSGWSGKVAITINDETFEDVQRVSGTYGVSIYPIKLGEKDAQLVMRGGKLSVAVDGISTDGQEIDTGTKPPWWIYIFLVLCAIPVFTGGGVGAACGFGFGMLSYIFACKKGKSKTAKFFVALGSTLAAWIIWIVIAVIILG